MWTLCHFEMEDKWRKVELGNNCYEDEYEHRMIGFACWTSPSLLVCNDGGIFCCKRFLKKIHDNFLQMIRNLMKCVMSVVLHGASCIYLVIVYLALILCSNWHYVHTTILQG